MVLAHKECPYCEKKTNHSIKIVQHEISVHAELDYDTVFLKFTCINCLRSYELRYSQNNS